MKKIFGKIAVSCTLLLINGSLFAQAAVIGNNAGSSQSSASSSLNPTGKTDLTIQLEQNAEQLNPIDPKQPDQVLMPNQNGAVNGYIKDDPLQLVYVPANLAFEKQHVDVMNKIQSNPLPHSSNINDGTIVNDKALIQVSDARGTRKGWHLTVSGSKLEAMSSDNSTSAKASTTPTTPDVSLDTIDGAELKLGVGDVSFKNGQNQLSHDKSVVADSEGAENVLDNGQNVILNAPEGKGYGFTVDQIDRKDITLTIPTNTGRNYLYSTTLNWTLVNSPQK